MTEDATKAKDKRLWLLVVAGLLIVLFVLLGWLARTLMSGMLKDDQANTLQLTTVEPCNLHQGPCTARYGKQLMRFSITGPALNSEHQLNFAVQLDNIEADQVSLQLQGKDMYMGENRYILQPPSKAKPGAATFSAAGQLPACTTGTMVWIAQLNITTDTGMMQARFEFETL